MATAQPGMEKAAKAAQAARGVAKEFREFLLKQNVVALAAGVVIGAAIGKVVSGIVDDVLMPIVGMVLPGQGEWRLARLALGSAGNAIAYGDLIGRLVDFAIVAVVVFLVLKALVRPAPAVPAPATKACPECLEIIPAAARRCRACGSAV
ncbi:MAG TPA: large conductance mechanosensitive channel protein MscL [Anaeromyxobacteraceae bacterium]|nr:large conductance mechanosensitive channel protein MscL [Anaeromyxobacteraceae bacterium]